MRITHLLPLSCALRLVTAAVIWLPAEFDPRETTSLSRRDSNLVSCPAPLPSEFTCPQGLTCTVLSTNASVKAALCCPAGQDCSLISPISCDQNLQNAALHPDSQLHVDPPTTLEACGAACCPLGYSCSKNRCQKLPVAAIASSTSTAASETTTTSTAGSDATTTSTIPSTSSTAAAAAAAATLPPSGTLENPGSGSSSKFSGASFAAGFIPGIALGAFIAACLVLILLRKHRGDSDSYNNEKQNRRDTLTDLGTLSRRPTIHGRSISEPRVDPSAGHRTEFSRNTPPRLPECTPHSGGYTVEATGPVTPARTPKAVRALFSRSPFLNQTPSTPRPTQPPVPAHLKRGTLSYAISPVRALKKQKSMHSLRRQMTDASRSSSNRRNRPDVSRNGSTETIRVLMPSNEPYTPDQKSLARVAEHTPPSLGSDAYHGRTGSSSTWQTTSTYREQPAHPVPPQANANRGPMTQTYTPTRVPAAATGTHQGAGGLSTPYTPSRYYADGNAGQGKVTDVLIGEDGGLKVVREPGDRRDTTFSAMMERAGLRKSDLVMGTGGRSALG